MVLTNQLQLLKGLIGGFLVQLPLVYKCLEVHGTDEPMTTVLIAVLITILGPFRGV